MNRTCLLLSDKLLKIPKFILFILYKIECTSGPDNVSDRKLIDLLKSLGPIDRKFHGHGENDGYVVCVFLCNKKSKENYMSTVSINYVRFKQ